MCFPISVIIPVYNSEETLKELINRIKRIFSEISLPYEIIMVDDCSSDNSWKTLKELNGIDNKLKIIRLIRNFGQHNATLCGFKYSKGDYIITLDDDLQHPPEEIPKLIEMLNNGYSVIYGKYEAKNDNILSNYLSNKYQYLMHHILEIPESIFISSFVIYRKEVVTNVISIKNSFPFLPAMVVKSAPIYQISHIEVNHSKREIGKSNYGLIKYFKYSLNLIINYSSLPLKLVTTFGMIISLMSIIYSAYIVVNHILDPTYGIMGWNSLIVAITLLGGIILLSLGIIGEYLRRILTEVSYGQQYAINEIGRAHV